MRYALAAVILAAAPASARVGGLEGVWLVANPLPMDLLPPSVPVVNEPIRFAARCGVKVDAYPAESFEGIEPGTTVVGAGPYASDKAAASALRQIKPCVPAASLKRLIFYGR